MARYNFMKEDAKNPQPYVYFDSQDAPVKGKDISQDISGFQDIADKLPIKDPDGLFTLKLSPNSSSDTLKFQLAMNKEVWNFPPESTVRSNIKNAYIAFIKSLDAAGTRAVNLNTVKSCIAAFLPMTFDEVLFYNYGLTSDPVSNRAYVDLQQGMRLRVDFQVNQMVHPSGTTPDQYINGFVSSGSCYFHVTSYIKRYADKTYDYMLGFNPFLNLLPGVGPKENDGGGGGVIDLYKNGYSKPFYRLFFPAQFPSSFSNGETGTFRNVTLVGARTINALENATTEYMSGGKVTESADVITFYFRGRAIAIPEIVIFNRRLQEYVPLGTTVRQLMERYTTLPRQSDKQITGNKLIYSRNVVQFVFADNYLTNVKVEYGAYIGFQNGSDVFDLPVLKGDSYDINM